MNGVSALDLCDLFAPFLEWSFLNRDDKRQLLSALGAEFHVADYRITGVSILCPDVQHYTNDGKESAYGICGDNVNRIPAASSMTARANATAPRR